MAPIASAATGSVVVSLTFDDNAVNQYNLAYNAPGALKDSGVPATFFVNSGTIGTGPGFMNWSQVSALATAGNDIGGKTVNAGNLTTDPDPTTQVCQDRQNLIQHGITPDAFAYPGGATNATVEGIVNSCGYGNARGAGGLGPEPGAPNADTIPAADRYASLSYAPSATTLANLESIVTNANSKGGGWIQVVLGNVCDQTLDPTNYSACSASWGHSELQDLITFLGWVKTSGQANAAPSGTTFSTVGQVSKSGDTTAPITTATCNGSPCATTPYTGTVTVAAGNQEVAKSQSIRIDTVAPTVAITAPANNATVKRPAAINVTATASDTGGSGVTSVSFYRDGVVFATDTTSPYTGSYTLTTLLAVGNHTLTAIATDAAGNTKSSTAITIKIT